MSLSFVENVIVAGADNHPPMLDKTQYMVHHQSYQPPNVNQLSQAYFPLMDPGIVVPSFLPSDDPVASLNKAMAFISTVFTSRYPTTNNQLRTSSNLKNQATIQDGKIQVQTILGRQNQGYAGISARSNATATRGNRLGELTQQVMQRNSTWFKEKAMLAEALESRMEIPTLAAFQTDDLDAFDSNDDEAPSASAILMAKHSSYDSEVLQSVWRDNSFLLLEVLVANHSSVVHHQSYQPPNVNQLSQAYFPLMDPGIVVPSFLPSDDPVASLNKAMAFIRTVFTSRYPTTNNQLRTSSNLKNQATIQDGKIQVQTILGRQNQGYAGISARSNATATRGNRLGELTQQVMQRNSTWFKEKAMLAEALESRMEIPTLAAFQTDDLDAFDSNDDEAPSASAILMAKHSSYDSEVLQRKVPALYCGNTMFKQHDALSVIDTKKTLELAEESRLKTHAKQNDSIAKEKKVNIAPIDYVALNKLSEHFLPQKQLSTKHAFWLPILKLVFEIPPVQPKLVLKEIPCELPTINLVKDSFNKMRSHVNDFENVEAHVDYLKHTQENTDTLREILEQARELRPLDRDLDFA
nr:hypothetical protein [Tanacetum cinerariifolium]